jgi:HD superfamily phosphodiesterase
MRRKFQLIVSETLVARARDLATRNLREDADRVRHLGAVAERAEALSVTVPATMVDTRVAAGWLHDIGYAPASRPDRLARASRTESR